MNDLLFEAYEQITDKLICFPASYLKQCHINKYNEFLKDTTHIFTNIARIFIFIVQEEFQAIDKHLLKLYTKLNMMYYMQQTFHRQVKLGQSEFQAIGNVLLIDTIKSACQLEIPIINSIKTNEVCSHNDSVLYMEDSYSWKFLILKNYWDTVAERFIVYKDIVDHFFKKHISQDSDKWAEFFQYYLVYKFLIININNYNYDIKHGIFNLFFTFAIKQKYELNRNLLQHYKMKEILIFIKENEAKLKLDLKNSFLKWLAENNVNVEKFFFHIYMLEQKHNKNNKLTPNEALFFKEYNY